MLNKGLKIFVIGMLMTVSVFFNGCVSFDGSSSVTSSAKASSPNEAILANNISVMQTPWTMLREVPALHNQNKDNGLPSDDTGAYYYKGTSFGGVPYSNTFYAGGDVLYNRNLSSFYSAVLNPASVVYTRRAGGPASNIRADYYGVVCSSLVGYILGQDIFYLTNQLEDQLDFYQKDILANLKAGDVMLREGHVKIVSKVMRNAKGGIDKVEVFEAAAPWVRTMTYTLPRFKPFLQENGGKYRVGKFKNQKPLVKLEPLSYNKDIISEYGDKTWYEIGQPVWLYLAKPSEKIYVYKSDSPAKAVKDSTAIAVSSLPQKQVNGVTVYDVSRYMNSTGSWCIKTDINSKDGSVLEVIDTGSLNLSKNGNVTLSGYSANVKPEWYVQITFRAGNASKYWYPSPAQQVAVQHKKDYINSNSFAVDTVNNSVSGYVRVFYKTRFGLAYKDSNCFFRNKGIVLETPDYSWQH